MANNAIKNGIFSLVNS